MLGRDAVERGEDLDLEIDALGHRLDHQIRLAAGVVDRVRGREARVAPRRRPSRRPCRWRRRFSNSGRDVLEPLVERLLARVLKDGAEAAERGGVGDAAPHDAGAEHRDGVDVHVSIPGPRSTHRHTRGKASAASVVLMRSPGMNGRSPCGEQVSRGHEAREPGEPGGEDDGAAEQHRRRHGEEAPIPAALGERAGQRRGEWERDQIAARSGRSAVRPRPCLPANTGSPAAPSSK